MNRYQKGQNLHTSTVGQFAVNHQKPQAQKRNAQNYGQFGITQWSKKLQAKPVATQWSGINNYNQNMTYQMSGKRNNTGINSHQLLQNQIYRCNNIQNTYPRTNGSHIRYNTTGNNVGNGNQVHNLGQRFVSGQLAYDRNEVLRNIYHVKGVAGVRHVSQQQSSQQYSSASNLVPSVSSGNFQFRRPVNTGSSCKKDFNTRNHNSALDNTDRSNVPKHIDAQRNTWKRTFSELRDDMKTSVDKEVEHKQTTTKMPCVFVTVSCSEVKDSGPFVSRQCQSDVPDKHVSKSTVLINRIKSHEMKASSDNISTVANSSKHMQKRPIPGCYGNNTNEHKVKEENKSPCAMNNCLSSNILSKYAESNTDKGDKYQHHVKKRMAQDVINEYVRRSVPSDSNVCSLSKQVEIRRNNGNGNHVSPEESGSYSCDKKQVGILHRELLGNTAKNNDKTKQSGKKFPSLIHSGQNMNKKTCVSVTPILSNGEKTGRMDSELDPTQSKALTDLERYSNLKPNFRGKAINESNQNPYNSDETKANPYRVKTMKKTLKDSRETGNVSKVKLKHGDVNLNDRLSMTKSEQEENRVNEKNISLTCNKDKLNGRIETAGTLKYCKKYNESNVGDSETDQENKYVSSTVYHEKTLKGKLNDQHIVSSDKGGNAHIVKYDGNVFSKINQMINNAKPDNKSKKLERLPLSPHQNVNRQESTKKVKFDDIVISVEGNGKISTRKIEDSKPYRQAISLFEKRRKIKKTKHKGSKSGVKLKQKLAIESKELIKLEKHMSRLTEFKIPKRHADENSLEREKIVEEVSKKKVSEKTTSLACKKQFEPKEGVTAKTFSRATETKIEKPLSVEESVLQNSDTETAKNVNTVKKRNIGKKKNTSALSGMKSRKEVMKSQNIIKTECMMGKSLTTNTKKSTKKHVDEKVQDTLTNLKCEVNGKENILKRFPDSCQLKPEMQNKSLGYGLDIKEDLNKNGYERKRLAKKRSTLQENKVKEKPEVIQKKPKAKFKRIRIMSDSDSDEHKVPKVFAKYKERTRLSEDDASQALGAACFNGGKQDDTGNEDGRLTTLCTEKLSKDSKTLTEQKEDKVKHKAFKLTCSENDKISEGESSYYSHTGKKRNKTKGCKTERGKKIKESIMNREADLTLTDGLKNESSIASVQEFTRNENDQAENIDLRDHEFTSNENREKKNIELKNVEKKIHERRYEKDNFKGVDTESKLPTVIKEDLTNKTAGHINNSVLNTKNNQKRDVVSGRSDIKCTLNSKQQNEKQVSTSYTSNLQVEAPPITKMGTLERRQPSVPEKIMRHPVNVNIESVKANAKANNSSRKVTEGERNVNLLEKKSLGYTAPDIQKKKNNAANVSAFKNDNRFSDGRTINSNKQQVKNNESKHLNPISDIVTQKLTELKAKADSLMVRNMNQHSTMGLHNTADVNRNYCNRSRLDGDKVTSHLFLPHKGTVSENNSIRDDNLRLKYQKKENKLWGNEAVGFPITVLNTRTPTVQSIESEEELQNTELLNQNMLTPSVQHYKDFSLPEHNKCLYSMKISDRTALSAPNLPDIQTFCREKQKISANELPNSSSAQLKSVYGETAVHSENDLMNVSVMQQPHKLNLTWKDIFPLPDCYFNMKKMFAGVNSTENETQPVVNYTDTFSSTESVNENIGAAGNLSMASGYTQSVANTDAGQTYTPITYNAQQTNQADTNTDTGQTYSPIAYNAQQTNQADTTCPLAEGPYIAYPVANRRVDMFHYPGEPLSQCLQRRDNVVQSGLYGNTLNQSEISTNYNRSSQTYDYQHGSNQFPVVQDNVFCYNHGMPNHDKRSFHISNKSQSFMNRTFIPPISNTPVNKGVLPPDHEQICPPHPRESFCAQQSSGWNPKIPYMDISFDETHSNETSVYMQSVIVQHKTLNRSNCESYSRKRDEREGLDGRRHNDTPANLNLNFYGDSVFPANAVVSENDSLVRNMGVTADEYQHEETESIKKPIEDINNNINSEAERGYASVILIDPQKDSNRKLHSAETTGDGNATSENFHFDGSKDEERQIIDNLHESVSSTLLNGAEAPKPCNGSVSNSEGTENETILDGSTGQFRDVKLTLEVLQSPENCNGQLASTKSTPESCPPLNANLSNVIVDQEVKGKMKYPLVMLSPLKMTKELEDMIDNCILTNSLNLDSAWLPILQSPLWSAESPSTLPRNSPVLAISNLSPPILSPCVSPKLNEIMPYDKQNMAASKHNISTTTQPKKRRETRCKMLKNILPTRQYDREKTLFETAEMFLGEDFPNKSSRKRKRMKRVCAENANKIKKAKWDRKKQLNELEEASCKRSEDVKESREPAEDYEINLKETDSDNKASSEAQKLNLTKDNFYTDADSEQLDAQKLREGEVNDVLKERQIKQEDISSDEELPLLQRVLEITKQLKPPVTLGENGTVKERKADIQEKSLLSNSNRDTKKEKSLFTKKGKRKAGLRKHHSQSNECKISDTVSDKRNVEECYKSIDKANGKSSKKQENDFECDREPKSTKETIKHDGSGISETADVKMEIYTRKKYANDELGSNSKQNTQEFIDINPSGSIVISRKDGQWALHTSRKMKRKSNTNQLQKTKESTQTGSDIEKAHDSKVEDEIKMNSKYVSDKSEQKESKKKRRRSKLMENDHKADQMESIERSICTDKKHDKEIRDSQGCWNSKTDRETDIKTENLRGTVDQENTKAVSILGKRRRACKLSNKTNTELVDVKVKRKPASAKDQKESKGHQKDLHMEIDSDRSDSSNVYVQTIGENAGFENKSTVESSTTQKSSAVSSCCKKSKKKKRCTVDSTSVLGKTILDVVSSADNLKKDAKKTPGYKISTDTMTLTSTKKEAFKRKKFVSDHLKIYSNKSLPGNKRAKVDIKKLNQKDDGQLRCGICDEIFTTKELLNVHILIHHPYRCSWCKLDFDSKEASKEHYFSHMRKTYHCSPCGKKYGNSTTYQMHLKSKRHQHMMEKGQGVINEENASQQSVRTKAGRNSTTPTDEKFIVEIENVEEPVANWMPTDTVAQFYSSLQHTSQMSWCDFSVSNNKVELYYNQTDNNGYETGALPQCGFNPYMTSENVNTAYQDSVWNNIPNDAAATVGAQPFGLPTTTENMTGHHMKSGYRQSGNERMIDNNSVFEENGKVYTRMTDMRKPDLEHVNQRTDGTGYTEMTDDEDTDQQTGTSTLCRIANSFSLSSLLTEK